MRWTMLIDLAAIAGLGLTTWGFAELGGRCGLGPSLALLWGGAWLAGGALWIAAGLRPRRPRPDVTHR